MASTSQESALESSKPDEFTVSRSIQDEEDGLEKTSAFGANIGPSHNSYPTEENANSDTPVALANEQVLFFFFLIIFFSKSKMNSISVNLNVKHIKNETEKSCADIKVTSP